MRISLWSEAQNVITVLSGNELVLTQVSSGLFEVVELDLAKTDDENSNLVEFRLSLQEFTFAVKRQAYFEVNLLLCSLHYFSFCSFEDFSYFK